LTRGNLAFRGARGTSRRLGARDARLSTRTVDANARESSARADAAVGAAPRRARRARATRTSIAAGTILRALSVD
tara:strand:- start:2555 stop:2779 length:225 start_codon:yes stop_codon:yes gene_type:complete